MKFRFGFIAICAVAAGPAYAQYNVAVSEASISALIGGVDAQPEDIAVDASGNIIVIDEAPVANEHVLRFDSAGANGVKVTDETAILAAIDAVNGSAAQSAFTINNVSVAADGDYILTCGGAPELDSMVSVTPSGVITVLCTGVNATASPIEGCTGSAVIGNTAYVVVNGAFGAVEDAVLAVDTNGAGAPAIAPTVLANQAALEAATTGETAGGLNLGPICVGGSGLYVADSGGTGTTDDVVQIAVPGGAVNLLIDDATIEAALATTDVGFTGMTVSTGGVLWLANTFGTGASDDGVVKVTAPGTGGQTFTLLSEGVIAAGVSATSLSPARMAFNAATGKVLFANQGGETEGVIGIALTANVNDWSIY
ncbi:MAG: hypothetical protein ACR2IE_11870 [Candidatus Sumerlaeaceae bacterium]